MDVAATAVGAYYDANANVLCDMNPGLPVYSVKESLRFECFVPWKEMHDTGVKQSYVNYQAGDRL